MASGDSSQDQFDELAADFVARRRRGESPSVDEYASAHPDLADLIRELFPTLDFVERAASVGNGGATAVAPAGPVSFPGLTVLREIAPGVGGFGRVYECREASLDRIVAVKTLLAHVSTPEGRATFEREARAAAGLDHPHILEVHSFHPDHQPPYLVMKYVDGAPLLAACEGRSALFVAGVVEKVARALEFAHTHGIVHRDVKPDNILVDRAGEPHVTDFGLAKPLDMGAPGGPGDPPHFGPRVAVSGIKGTPRFIAPEVYAGRGSGGPQVDVYALGVTLYTVLCRRPPFTGASFGEIRQQVLEAEPPFPQDVNPGIPEPLQRICLQAMERDPADRYESAGAMAADLQRFRTGAEVTARPRRYLRELRGRLRTHVAEIGVWRERRLIDVAWMDRLTRPYVRLLAQEPPRGDSSGSLATAGPFRWDLLLLRFGGVLVLVTTVLWPVFYWEELGTVERVAAVGVPALLLNAVGWWAHRRGNPRGAVAFLSVGTALVPLFVDVLRLCARRPDEAVELFRRGTSDVHAPTNLQITLSLACLSIYALLALRIVRARAFAVWFGVSLYLLLTGALLLGGLRRLIDDNRLAVPFVLYATLAFLFVPVARRIRLVEDGRWSGVLYTFFPVPYAAAMTALALAGVRQLGDNKHAHWDDAGVQHWLMANTAVYLIGAYRCSRADVSFARFWAPFFLALVPISLLTPANVLFGKAPYLFIGAPEVGVPSFTIYEALAAVISVACIAVGTRLRRRTVLFSGLVGTAIFIVRATDRHFEGALGWPLGLAVTGALALAGGATLAWWRMQHDPDATE